MRTVGTFLVLLEGFDFKGIPAFCQSGFTAGAANRTSTGMAKTPLSHILYSLEIFEKIIGKS